MKIQLVDVLSSYHISYIIYHISGTVDVLSSYHIISCHVISYHIISYHIISYHIITCWHIPNNGFLIIIYVWCLQPQKKMLVRKSLPIWRWYSHWTTLTLQTPPARRGAAFARWLRDSLWSPGLVVFTEPQRRLYGWIDQCPWVRGWVELRWTIDFGGFFACWANKINKSWSLKMTTLSLLGLNLMEKQPIRMMKPEDFILGSTAARVAEIMSKRL